MTSTTHCKSYVLAAGLIGLVASDRASAQQPQAPAPAQAPIATAGFPPTTNAYYSWRLQSYLLIQPIDLSPYGWWGYRPVAQLVSTPPPFSPLGRIGLRPGDMITRLDD